MQIQMFIFYIYNEIIEHFVSMSSAPVHVLLLLNMKKPHVSMRF